MKLIDRVKLDYVFHRYVDNSLVYYSSIDPDWEVRVPVKDLKGAVLHYEEKGLTLMKWIRQRMELTNAN